MSTAISRLIRIVLAAAVGVLPPLAGHAQELTIGLKAPIHNIDPHFYNQPTNNAFSRHMFESLVVTDHELAIRPALAESWVRPDESTWEFRLRRQVKFHDGSEFSADDVLFSFSRARHMPYSPSGFSRYTEHIVAVDKVDTNTVRIKTGRPYPQLLHDIAHIRIIALKAAEGKTTREIDAGQGVVGTGPYRFEKWEPGKPAVLRRHERYWGAVPAWERVTFLPLPDDAARVEALVRGTVRLIDALPAERVKKLRRKKKFAILKRISNRLIFLQLDSGRNKSPFITGTRGKNPLRRLNIRRAISLAINRKAITSKIMKGGAVPAGQLLPDGLPGRVQDLNPDQYDPKAARRQLARGGYPRGFGVTLHGPSGQYANGGKVLEAVAAGLKRIGIVTEVNIRPGRIFFPLAAKRSFSLFLYSWRLDSGDATEPLRALLATHGGRGDWGSLNFGRYSNPDLDVALKTALGTMEDTRRLRLLQEATRIAMRSYGVIPLYFELNQWAVRKGLRFLPRVDGATLAMNAAPAR